MERNAIEISDFGLRVSRAIRGQLGERRLSGRQLAEGIGRSHGYVRARIADEQEWKLADIARICRFLDITPEELLK